MVQRWIVRCAALVAAFSMTSAAQAAMVTLRATGAVTFVDNSSSLLPIAMAGTAIGDTFAIEYSFDSNVVDADPSINVGAYNFGSAFTLTATIDGVAHVIANPSSSVIGVRDDFAVGPGSYIDTYAVSANLISGVLVTNARIDMFNQGAATSQPGLNSQLLPVAGFDPTIFANRMMQLRFSRFVNGVAAGDDLIVGSVTRIDTVGEVPLPAAAWLLLSGLGGLGVLVRRRRLRS